MRDEKKKVRVEQEGCRTAIRTGWMPINEHSPVPQGCRFGTPPGMMY